jgi:hypothetical protein
VLIGGDKDHVVGHTGSFSLAVIVSQDHPQYTQVVNT